MNTDDNLEHIDECCTDMRKYAASFDTMMHDFMKKINAAFDEYFGKKCRLTITRKNGSVDNTMDIVPIEFVLDSGFISLEYVIIKKNGTPGVRTFYHWVSSYLDYKLELL